MSFKVLPQLRSDHFRLYQLPWSSCWYPGWNNDGPFLTKLPWVLKIHNKYPPVIPNQIGLIEYLVDCFTFSRDVSTSVFVKVSWMNKFVDWRLSELEMSNVSRRFLTEKLLWFHLQSIFDRTGRPWLFWIHWTKSRRPLVDRKLRGGGVQAEELWKSEIKFFASAKPYRRRPSNKKESKYEFIEMNKRFIEWR